MRVGELSRVLKGALAPPIAQITDITHAGASLAGADLSEAGLSGDSNSLRSSEAAADSLMLLQAEGQRLDTNEMGVADVISRGIAAKSAAAERERTESGRCRCQYTPATPVC